MTQSPTVPYGNQHGNQPPGEAKNNGLGVAALVVGIVALIIAWIPCINFLAILLALVAVGLGIAGWISASGKPDQKATFSIIGLILGVVAVIAFFISWAVFGAMAEGGLRGIGDRISVVTNATTEAEAAIEQARQRGVSEDVIAREEQAFDREMERISTEAYNGSVEDMRARAQEALDTLKSNLQAAPATETPSGEPAASDDPMSAMPSE